MVQRRGEKPKKIKISRKQTETYERIQQREAELKGKKRK